MVLASSGLAEWTQNIGLGLEWLFGGDTPEQPLHLHQVAARACTIYFVGLILVRIGKSRMIGRTTALDIILGFILGSILARGITGNASISGTTVAAAVLIASHWFFTSLACRSHRFGNLIKGLDYCPLIINGELQRHTMRRSNLSEHDVMEELRLHGVAKIDEVAAAYKERNGQVSVILRKMMPQIVDVAVHDGVQNVRIELR
jgi:uncharacterized membrane protein YcaP (DUF421 family)